MSLTPEEEARETIDAQLGAAGWVVQDIAEFNLSASRGVAVRELPFKGGPVDYMGFDNPIPAEFQWFDLSSKSGDEPEWSGAISTTRRVGTWAQKWFFTGAPVPKI